MYTYYYTKTYFPLYKMNISYITKAEKNLMNDENIML